MSTQVNKIKDLFNKINVEISNLLQKIKSGKLERKEIISGLVIIIGLLMKLMPKKTRINKLVKKKSMKKKSSLTPKRIKNTPKRMKSSPKRIKYTPKRMNSIPKRITSTKQDIDRFDSIKFSGLKKLKREITKDNYKRLIYNKLFNNRYCKSDIATVKYLFKDLIEKYFLSSMNYINFSKKLVSIIDSNVREDCLLPFIKQLYIISNKNNSV